MMTRYFTILFSPDKSIDFLMKNDDAENSNKTNYIFTLSSLLPFFTIGLLSGDWSTVSSSTSYIVPIVTGIIISFVIMKYMIPLILLWTSKLLGGKCNNLRIRFIYAFSLIPTIVLFFVKPLIYYMEDNKIENLLFSWTLYILYWISMIWMLFILVIGLRKINDYSYTKAIINVSPILILNAIFILIYK